MLVKAVSVCGLYLILATMDRTDSSSAMSLLQSGYGEGSDEDTSFTELKTDLPQEKSPQRKPRRSSGAKGDPHSATQRQISDEGSFEGRATDFISDEEGDHHLNMDDKPESDNVEQQPVSSRSASPDTQKQMSSDQVNASSQEEENSNASFPEEVQKHPKKRPSRAKMRLVSYGPDEMDEDEDASEVEDESNEDDEESEGPDMSSSINDNPVSSPAPRGLAGMDSSNIQLPPEPTGRCSKELQEKIADFHKNMKVGTADPNKQIQRLTSFRNPGIYEKLIQQFKIDEKGSNFPLDIYNPHMWGKDSFYDELDKAQKKDMERREKERKEKTKIEFMSGTKKTSAPTDISGAPDEKKRKSKWDAQPMGLQQQGLRQGSTAPAGVVNLTTSATGTKATVISAVGTLSKKSSSGSVSNSSSAK